MSIIEEAFRETPHGGASTKNTFSGIAPVYDLMNSLISFGLIRYWRRCAAQHLTLRPGETGLDLGTGTADLAIAIARSSAPEARVIGMDITPEMLERGRMKLRQRDLQDRVVLLRGDAKHIDLPDNSVDACYSAFLVRNLTDMAQGFREMLRVVRPGGHVICLEVSHPSSKVFRELFHLYFYTCAPLFGMLLGQMLHAYQYLPCSLKSFPNAPELQAIMEECGWRDVYFRRLSSGMVAIHVGTKC